MVFREVSKLARPNPEAAQDKEASMGTNSYSIVSKQSVEKLYFPNDPQFFSFFCKDYKRRAPLINRGYWLRMKSIENVTEQFVTGPGTGELERIKVVINLGAGYDPLPWRIRHRLNEKGLDRKYLFIDVDYPELLEKKARMIQDPIFGNEELREIDCGGCHYSAYNGSWYAQVGADLGDLKQLEEGMDIILGAHTAATKDFSYDFLFVAEVSTAYMPREKGAALFHWLANFKTAFKGPFELFDINEIRLVVLEQLVPSSKGQNPFPETMMAHFNKTAPLRSVWPYLYQKKRFTDLGWASMDISTLYQVWAAREDILSQEEKDGIREIEPFDEWEEFVLYSTHYALIQASNLNTFSRFEQAELLNPALDFSKQRDPAFFTIASKIFRPHRCFAQAIVHEDGAIRQIGGSQQSKNLQNCSSRNEILDTMLTDLSDNVLCHTMTRIYEHTFLLVGGRASPSKISGKCLLHHAYRNKWTTVQDISPARFRHSATRVMLGNEPGVLVFGGRDRHGNALSDWQFFSHVRSAWLPVKSHEKLKRFSAALISDSNTTGILLGGFDNDGRVSQDIWRWTCERRELDIQINLISLKPNLDPAYLARAGATAINTIWGPAFVGGVSPGPPAEYPDMFILRATGEVTFFPQLEPRPLLVGTSVVATESGFTIMGGGAVCFSFGSRFNTHKYEICRLANLPPEDSFIKDGCYIIDGAKDDARLLSSFFSMSSITPAWRGPRQHISKQLPVDRVPISDMESLASRISSQRMPYVIKNLQKSPSFTPQGTVPSAGHNPTANCLKWTVDSISHALADKRLSVHTNPNTRYLQFAPVKNFSYEVIDGRDLAKYIYDPRQHCYLRGLSNTKPFKKPANIWDDFPALGEGFRIPDPLNEQFRLLNDDGSSNLMHSSVLRVSGNVALWLHYDVMSNFWFQISGSKRVLLFPPTDVANRLAFNPGETVSSLNIKNFEIFTTKKVVGKFAADTELNSLPLDYGLDSLQMLVATGEVKDTEKAYAVTLNAGEILYIPRFWGHTTFPDDGGTDGRSASPSRDGQASTAEEETVESSIAVNIFFREGDIPDSALAPGKDVYASSDFVPYEQSRQKLRTIISRLKSSSIALDADILAATANDIARYLRTGRGEYARNDGTICEVKGEDLKAIRKRFDGLPEDVRMFYLEKLGDEIQRGVARTEPGSLLGRGPRSRESEFGQQ